MSENVRIAASLRDLKRIQKLVLSVKEMDSSLVIPNRDLTKDKVFSSLGQAVILEGKDNTCTLIDWSSNKAKRVVRSALAAEIYACGEAADSGVLVRYILTSILGCQEESISLLVTTDSNSLNQAVKTTSVLEDKRLTSGVGRWRMREGKYDPKVGKYEKE